MMCENEVIPEQDEAKLVEQLGRRDMVEELASFLTKNANVEQGENFDLGFEENVRLIAIKNKRKELESISVKDPKDWGIKEESLKALDKEAEAIKAGRNGYPKGSPPESPLIEVEHTSSSPFSINDEIIFGSKALCRAFDLGGNSFTQVKRMVDRANSGLPEDRHIKFHRQGKSPGLTPAEIVLIKSLQKGSKN